MCVCELVSVCVCVCCVCVCVCVCLSMLPRQNKLFDKYERIQDGDEMVISTNLLSFCISDILLCPGNMYHCTYLFVCLYVCVCL